jgi:hypothetical protein
MYDAIRQKIDTSSSPSLVLFHAGEPEALAYYRQVLKEKKKPVHAYWINTRRHSRDMVWKSLTMGHPEHVAIPAISKSKPAIVVFRDKRPTHVHMNFQSSTPGSAHTLLKYVQPDKNDDVIAKRRAARNAHLYAQSLHTRSMRRRTKP